MFYAAAKRSIWRIMPRRYSMAKREEATDRTRGRIEDALIRLLGSRPYNDITVVEIAAEADVAVRTVQRRYRTKDDLLLDACLRRTPSVTEQLQGLSAKSAQGLVQSLVRALFDFYEQHNTECWALHSRAAEVPKVRGALHTLIASRMSSLAELMTRWPDAWSVDGSLAARTLVALTSYPAWRGFTESGRFSPAGATDEVVYILSQRLLRPSQA